MKNKTIPGEIAELITDLKNKRAEAANALAQFNEKEQTRLAAIASLRSEIDETRHQATALLSAPGNAAELASRKRRLTDSIEIQEHRIKRLEIVLDDDLDALRAPQKPFFQLYSRLAGALVRAVEEKRQQLLDELGAVSTPPPMPPRDMRVPSNFGRLGARTPDPDVRPARVDHALQQSEALDFKPCTADLSKPTPHQIASDLKAAEEKLPALFAKIEEYGPDFLKALNSEPVIEASTSGGLRAHGKRILVDHQALEEKKEAGIGPEPAHQIPNSRFALP